jgi:hypothetical protein
MSGVQNQPQAEKSNKEPLKVRIYLSIYFIYLFIFERSLRNERIFVCNNFESNV